MFSNSNSNDNHAKHLENTGVVNFIGVGTKIDGEISSNGDIRVDGTLNGSIKTKGKVVIGSTGIVGNVDAANADISGELKGAISVTSCWPKSHRQTRRRYGGQQIGHWARSLFSGSCSMGAVIKDISHANKAEKQEKTA